MSKPLFSQRLEQMMNELGIGTNELSRRCNIAKSTISQYRDGQYVAKFDRIEVLARELGCSAHWLAGKDVPMASSDEDFNDESIPVLLPKLHHTDQLLDDDNIAGYEKVEKLYRDRFHFFVTASNDSMEPVIAEGDLALCVRQDTLENGELGVFMLSDGTIFLRIWSVSDGEPRLHSINRYYPPRSLKALRYPQIIGRVIRTTHFW